MRVVVIDLDNISPAQQALIDRHDVMSSYLCAGVRQIYTNEIHDDQPRDFYQRMVNEVKKIPNSPASNGFRGDLGVTVANIGPDGKLWLLLASRPGDNRADEAILAFAGTRPKRFEPFTIDFNVICGPSYANILHAHIADWAVHRGYRTAVLEATEWAVPSYERWGYRVVGRPWRTMQGFNIVPMEKKL